MIEVTGLSKNYGSFTALQNISFTIKDHEIVGLLGPNGAGKTTLLKILTGFHFPTAGIVRVNDFYMGSDDLAIKRMIGYLPENAPIYPELLVAEYLSFIADTRIGKKFTGSGLRAVEAIDQAIESCNLQKVRHQSIQHLSRGFRQRVGIAQAILHDPQIIILDEPTSGLDPNQLIEIRRLIQNLGKTKTILLSTHSLSEVEASCQRVFILNQGQIAAQGTPVEIGTVLGRHWRCQIVLKGDIERFLKSISQNHAIDSLSLNNDRTHFELRCPHTSMETLEDFQEYIFDTAIDTHCKVLELTPQNSSLEDIFANLTRDRRHNV